MRCWTIKFKAVFKNCSRRGKGHSTPINRSKSLTRVQNRTRNEKCELLKRVRISTLCYQSQRQPHEKRRDDRMRDAGLDPSPLLARDYIVERAPATSAARRALKSRSLFSVRQQMQELLHHWAPLVLKTFSECDPPRPFSSSYW